MSLILSIETSTSSCSVALSRDGIPLIVIESNEKNIHASALTGFIEQAMQQTGSKYTDLDAVAVSKGPGSYTGLRIGVSTAKGLCFALDKPLIGINTLYAMAMGLSGQYESHNALFCPMIDARRMEVYCALYRADGSEVSPVEAKIIDHSSYSTELEKNRIVFFGDGAAKCREVLGDHPNAVFIDRYDNSARDMAGISETEFRKRNFEDLAYFEPYYLKDFIVTKPKVQ